MTEQELRVLFADMTHEEIVEVAINLSLDATRLRRELDDKDGIIR